MKLRELNQIEFSSVLFDTIFGLILFFSIDSFLDIKAPFHFILYLFSTFILVHWWLTFKSADDIFQEEVTDSALDLVFGIIYMILLDYIILLSRSFSIISVISFTLALVTVDLVWALCWRFVGKWNTQDTTRITFMEQTLNHNILIDAIMIILFSLLLIAHSSINQFLLLIGFLVAYTIYIILTFVTRIITIDIF